jgi:toxin FitB
VIILDTNVVSEPMRRQGDPTVAAWLDRQVAETLYLTSISLAELLVGVQLLPAGRRRDGIDAALRKLLSDLFGSRMLPFDERAAIAYATLVMRARAMGQAISVADGQIAAIALANGFAVATRDTAPFLAAGASVIDPWRTDL